MAFEKAMLAQGQRMTKPLDIVMGFSADNEEKNVLGGGEGLVSAGVGVKNTNMYVDQVKRSNVLKTRDPELAENFDKEQYGRACYCFVLFFVFCVGI